MKFITLTQVSGGICYVNPAEIRAIFPTTTGSSVNIGTMGNIPVVEKPQKILNRIARAFEFED